MVYLGYGLIAIVALVALTVTVRELTGRESPDERGYTETASGRRLVLHSNRPTTRARPTHRSW